MKLAIFGGAFDPIHNAHIAVAKEAARQCALDEVLFVPAAEPPHKRLHASYEDRYRMVELALEGEPGLTASRLEADAAPSYSIDTIEKLQRRLRPEDRLLFIIGADAFADIRTWKRWQDVVKAVEFIVVSRPGHSYEIPGGARVHPMDTVQLPLSSSDTRERLAAGANYVEAPTAVLRYIRDKGLYAPQM